MFEIKPHRWTENGRNMAADFCAFIDGEPRPDINCEDHCRHYIPDSDCKAVKEKWDPGKLYPFCGRICGHFEMR